MQYVWIHFPVSCLFFSSFQFGWTTGPLPVPVVIIIPIHKHSTHSLRLMPKNQIQKTDIYLFFRREDDCILAFFACRFTSWILSSDLYRKCIGEYIAFRKTYSVHKNWMRLRSMMGIITSERQKKNRHTHTPPSNRPTIRVTQFTTKSFLDTVLNIVAECMKINSWVKGSHQRWKPFKCEL